MKTSGFRCETKFGLLVFLGHPNAPRPIACLIKRQKRATMMSHSFFCRFAWHQLLNVLCKWTEILTHPTQKRGPTFILHIIAHFFEEKEPFRTFLQQSQHTIFTILNLENTRLLLLLSILRLSNYPFLFSFRFLCCNMFCLPLDQLHEYCNV